MQRSKCVGHVVSEPNVETDGVLTDKVLNHIMVRLLVCTSVVVEFPSNVNIRSGWSVANLVVHHVSLEGFHV